MKQVFLKGTPLTLDPKRSLGKGGEAEVWDIGNDIAVKVYKDAKHPDLTGDVPGQQEAKNRLALHQMKLPAFPTSLPRTVICPNDLVTDSTGKNILGYTMQLLRNTEVLRRYAERSFRSGGIPNKTVLDIFTHLHRTVKDIHAASVVIGDFNDLNVLVSGTEAYLIDADSFQFGVFPCPMFTARFVDPLKCRQGTSQLELIRPHDENSDWYAFAVMFMQSLLYVDPYGGVYRPGKPEKRIAHELRPLNRITVFHPEVRYPKPALPLKILPDSLLETFQRIFEKDERGIFPLHLIESLRFTTCTACGIEHARTTCPNCQQATQAMIKEIRRGNATFSRIFRTSGKILYATVQEGELKWLFHEQGMFKRESETLAPGSPDPRMRFRIQGKKTLIAQQERVITLLPGSPPEQLIVDTFGSLPIVDANENCMYWVSQGFLYRNGEYAPEIIGSVLPYQTQFWVGKTFGFGFYRAGNYTVSFVFDTKNPGVTDTIPLTITGQLLDAHCVFSSNYCWFMTAVQEKGRTKHTCHVIHRSGRLESAHETDANDGTWLGTIRGKFAVDQFLFAATDDGIVRVQSQNGTIGNLSIFSDTEPFVSSGHYLFPERNGGIYVVSGHEIHILRLS